MMKDILVPIHPDGWKFIGIFAGISVLLCLVAAPLGFVGFILTAWCTYFFRNPDRVTPQGEGLVISAADGKVVDIKEVIPPKELALEEQPYRRISVFLNVFNVHVNKIPFSGTIDKMTYVRGKFFNASLDKASEHNERLATTIRTDYGVKIGVVQIAGLVARRICWDIEEGDKVKVGQDFGLIRFGSRVDVYIPLEWKVKVSLGQTMIAGETIIACSRVKECYQEDETNEYAA